MAIVRPRVLWTTLCAAACVLLLDQALEAGRDGPPPASEGAQPAGRSVWEPDAFERAHWRSLQTQEATPADGSALQAAWPAAGSSPEEPAAAKRSPELASRLARALERIQSSDAKDLSENIELLELCPIWVHGRGESLSAECERLAAAGPAMQAMLEAMAASGDAEAEAVLLRRKIAMEQRRLDAAAPSPARSALLDKVLAMQARADALAVQLANPAYRLQSRVFAPPAAAAVPSPQGAPQALDPPWMEDGVVAASPAGAVGSGSAPNGHADMRR